MDCLLASWTIFPDGTKKSTETSVSDHVEEAIAVLVCKTFGSAMSHGKRLAPTANGLDREVQKKKDPKGTQIFAQSALVVEQLSH